LRIPDPDPPHLLADFWRHSILLKRGPRRFTQPHGQAKLVVRTTAPAKGGDAGASGCRLPSEMLQLFQ
jgi:hypothetical protein